MNRYWLFQECEYEAQGGLSDLVYTFKTIKEAKEYISENPGGDLAYIIDSLTWKMVCRTDNLFDSRHNKQKLKWKKITDVSFDKGAPKKGLKNV